MAMTPLHVQNYCHASNGSCKYVEDTYDPMTGKSLVLCTKLSPNAYQKMLEEDPTYHFYTTGRRDNCQGYLYLKNIEQGFDVDKKKK